jgi:feruloyl-CoA synthase
LSHFAPYAQDVVIAGHDRDYVSALIFPNVDACRKISPDAGPTGEPKQLLDSAPVRSLFETLLKEFAQTATGSSNRIVGAILLDEPPSIDAHEVTDKGSINQRAVLDHRVELVAELYDNSARAIRIE